MELTEGFGPVHVELAVLDNSTTAGWARGRYNAKQLAVYEDGVRVAFVVSAEPSMLEVAWVGRMGAAVTASLDGKFE